MPKLTPLEKAQKKLELEAKREARKLAKEQKEKEKAIAAAEAAKKAPSTTTSSLEQNTTTNNSSNGHNNKNDGDGEDALILHLTHDTIHHIMCFLPSRDIGILTMTCRHFAEELIVGRISYLLSRLHRQQPSQSLLLDQQQQQHRPPATASNATATLYGYTNMCTTTTEAQSIIQQSYGGGSTGQINSNKGKKYNKTYVNEFVSYGRFIEEAVCGYSTMKRTTRNNTPPPIQLPPFVNGRFVSASPEHSLSRVGGNGSSSGPGGSGVASWGVGKRGQLGHGKRKDEYQPKMLLGGIGYGIRIVQVSAGGGLVRVAHSLLLTSTGRVLSFGTGQYGALGHGYSAGKQLPDVLRPKYIDALQDIPCICAAAGELHSAVVTIDGDVYTWGDGFCGQLGHGDKRPQPSPQQVIKGGLDEECILTISCGARHTIAITEDNGDVYTWGLGHFGVLGRSYTPFDHDPDTAVINWGPEVAGGVLPPLGLDGHVVPAGPGPVNDYAEALVAAPNNSASDTAGVVEPNHENDVEEEEETNGPPVGGGGAADLIAHLDMLANLSLTDSSDQCIPKLVDSLQGIKIVGSSAGHRHTLLLDEQGGLYSCGAGVSGCLGHGDNQSQMYPMKIRSFEDDNVRIMKMSAGVDMSMAVSTTGDVYGWGKMDRGRCGLGLQTGFNMFPRRVPMVVPDGDTGGSSSGGSGGGGGGGDDDDGDNKKKAQQQQHLKAVDVDCGYVHSLVVGLNGTVHMCGEVGINGANDGGDTAHGTPIPIDDFNIWHRIPEPKEQIQVQAYKKYGKYEIKGKRKMMTEMP